MENSRVLPFPAVSQLVLLDPLLQRGAALSIRILPSLPWKNTTGFRRPIWNNKGITLLKRTRAFLNLMFSPLEVKRLCLTSSRSNILLFAALGVQRGRSMRNSFVFILARVRSATTAPGGAIVAPRSAFLISGVFLC